jgi:hypothetical protein
MATLSAFMSSIGGPSFLVCHWGKPTLGKYLQNKLSNHLSHNMQEKKKKKKVPCTDEQRHLADLIKQQSRHWIDEHDSRENPITYKNTAQLNLRIQVVLHYQFTNARNN